MTAQCVRPEPFYDRSTELAALERAWRLPGQGGLMGLVYGRRRIGKTYLMQRFLSDGPSGGAKPHCYYLAVQTSAAQQRLALAEMLAAVLPSVGADATDLAVSWNALLRHVSSSATHGERFCLILDEFPYLVQQSPELPSVLQAWWDQVGRHSRLLVLLCGSHLSVMESLGHAGAPLFGRFDAGVIRLSPMRYDEVADFYAASPAYEATDKLRMYGILGGTPRYHAMVDTTRSLGHEVAHMLLSPHGPLRDEVRYLLSSEQIRDPAPYHAVMASIAGGATRFGEILNATGTDRGALSFHLRTLIELEWATRELPFGEDSERRAIYRLADPFLLFWYRFVAGQSSLLQFADPITVFAERIQPALPLYMGLHVFERVCREWLERRGAALLGARAERAARYWSRDGQLEIDLVAATSDGRHAFCECKWNERRPASVGVYDDLRAKVAALPDHRLRSEPAYILFAVGGFSDDLRRIASSPASRLHLVGLDDLLPGRLV